MLVGHPPSPLEGGGKCLRLVGRIPSPLEGEGAVVLEPCGESYECGRGVKTRIYTTSHLPSPLEGGGKCLGLVGRIPSPLEGEGRIS